MATGQTVIDAATALVRVRTAGVTFSTDDANGNTELFLRLQNLISEWGEDGVLNIPAPSAVGDTLDIPEGTIRALEYNLAMEAGTLFGKQPDPMVVKFAEETKDRLESEISLDLSVDLSGLPLGSSQYDIEQDA